MAGLRRTSIPTEAFLRLARLPTNINSLQLWRKRCVMPTKAKRRFHAGQVVYLTVGQKLPVKLVRRVKGTWIWQFTPGDGTLLNENELHECRLRPLTRREAGNGRRGR